MAVRVHSVSPSWELSQLLDIFPLAIRQALVRLNNIEDIIEVVLDLGRPPEARFEHDFKYLTDTPVSHEDIAHVCSRISPFGADNRAGIEQTLHRISAIRNRTGKIVGLTCRVGRAVYGTIDILLDVLRSGKSICLLGRPGVGKTTMLRECARVLSEERKRVVIVDTSNEIAGDSDIPHPGIGLARRMQVADPALQHAVMIEAVENHMPEVIVIDEIGTAAEAEAARTIAERGVTLIGTAHGQTLENLLMNPTLSDLVGGVSAVTLSDEEARRRGTRKTVLERKAPPTFDVVVEIHDRDRLAIHKNVAEVIDALLRGYQPQPEIRQREPSGEVTVVQEADTESMPRLADRYDHDRDGEERDRPLLIFPYGVSRNKIERAISNLRVQRLDRTQLGRRRRRAHAQDARAQRAAEAQADRIRQRADLFDQDEYDDADSNRPARRLQPRLDRQRRDRPARDRRGDLSSAPQQFRDRALAADVVYPPHAASARGEI